MEICQALEPQYILFLMLVIAMCLPGVQCQTYTKAELVFPDGSTARNGTLFRMECDFSPDIFPKALIFQARDKFGNPSEVFSYITLRNGTVTIKAMSRLKGRATLKPTRFKFLLEINPVLLPDEGNYGCRVFRDFSDQISAHPRRLNVNALPSKPLIRFATPGTQRRGRKTRIICSANTGKPAGHLIWSRRYRQDSAFQRISGTGVSSTHVNGTIRDTEDFVINYLKESDDLSVYRCEADNNELRPYEPRPTAEITLRVAYPVKDLTISPMQPVYEAGDWIQCAARGNPNPIISWLKLSGGGEISIREDKLMIEPSTIGGNHSYSCIATNTVDYYPYRLNKTYNFSVRGIPMMPSDLRVNDVTAVSATISWISMFDGGENQTFSIQYKPAGQNWSRHPSAGDISDPGLKQIVTFKISSLHPQMIYEFRVKACNPLCTSYTEGVTATTKASPRINVKDIQTIRAGELVTIRWRRIRTKGATFRIKYCVKEEIEECFYHYVSDSSATSTAVIVGKGKKAITVFLEVFVQEDVVYKSPPLTVKDEVIVITTTGNTTGTTTTTTQKAQVSQAGTGIIVATIVGCLAMVSIGVAVAWFMPKAIRNKMIARLRGIRGDRQQGQPNVITVNCTSETPIPTMPASTTVSDHGDGDRSTLEMEPIGRHDHYVGIPPEAIPLNTISGSREWKVSSDLQSKSEKNSLMGSEDCEGSEVE